ncbi:MAG: phenylalanine--tRNA ligase subunit beta, partial [Candidatus Njordarchaeota archaeon]
MPVLDTTLSRLQRYLNKKITIEELNDLLFRVGFELDSAKESQEDYELKIEITPDRPDCLSTIGLARHLRLYLGIEGPKKYTSTDVSEYKIYVDPSVEKIRPYIAGFVVKNLSISETDLLELIWTQEKLHDTFCRNRKKASIGLYSLSRISWPLRYYAEDPDKIRFVPLGTDEIL